MRHLAAVMVAGFMFLLSFGDFCCAAEPMRIAVAAIANRFIATGTVIDVQPAVKGIRKAVFRIETVRTIAGFANLGSEYAGKDAEVLSEIPLPPSFKIGAHLSVVLRVSGDEWQQKLFFVEVLDNGTHQ